MDGLVNFSGSENSLKKIRSLVVDANPIETIKLIPNHYGENTAH